MTQFNKLTNVSTVMLEELKPILHDKFDYLMKNK